MISTIHFWHRTMTNGIRRGRLRRGPKGSTLSALRNGASVEGPVWIPESPMAVPRASCMVSMAIFSAYVSGLNFRGCSSKIWPNIYGTVQYLHFRILEFPLMVWFPIEGDGHPTIVARI